MADSIKAHAASVCYRECGVSCAELRPSHPAAFRELSEEVVAGLADAEAMKAVMGLF